MSEKIEKFKPLATSFSQRGFKQPEFKIQLHHTEPSEVPRCASQQVVDSDNLFSSQSLLNINIDTSSISNDVTPVPVTQERMTIESQFQSRQELASNMEIDQSEKMGLEE